MVRRFNPSIRGALKVVLPRRWYSTALVTSCDFTYCYGGDWAQGKVGAYSLGFRDGVITPAEGVVVPHASDIAFGDSDDFTVACWAKNKDAAAGLGGFVSKTDTDGPGWVLGRWSPNQNFAFQIRDAVGRSECLSDDEYSDTNWHHLVGTRDGTTKVATLYVDGVAQAITTTREIDDEGTDLIIGRWYENSDTYHADAYIDEVGIWDVALTSTEITALYNSGAGARADSVTPPEVSPGVTGSLILYYDFEIATGQRSGNPVSGNFFALNHATSASVYDVTTAAFHPPTAHTGTMTNMSVADFGAWSQGKLGKYSFRGDGITEYIAIASSSYLPLGGGDESFSVSFWANNNEALDSYRTVIGRHDSFSSADLWRGGWTIQYNHGKGQTMRFSVGSYYDYTDMAFSEPKWDNEVNLTFRHVVATYNTDTNVSQIWIDGVKGTDGTKAAGAYGAPNPGTGIVQIGGLGSSPGYKWPGCIDEVAIYNVALTDGAISDLYNSGQGAKASTVSSSALVCYLDMECNGPGSVIAKDLSGNDLSGTIINPNAGTCG